MASPSLERLCKWRSILAGRITGSKPRDALGITGWRDLMERQLLYRVELSALAALLIKKGVFTVEEYSNQLNREAEQLETVMQRIFPGFRAAADGIEIVDVQIAQKTMADQGFPP